MRQPRPVCATLSIPIRFSLSHPAKFSRGGDGRLRGQAVLWSEAQDAAIFPLDGVGLLHQFLQIVCFGVEEAS